VFGCVPEPGLSVPAGRCKCWDGVEAGGKKENILDGLRGQVYSGEFGQFWGSTLIIFNHVGTVLDKFYSCKVFLGHRLEML
jgi:hypothetical protein